MMFNEGYQDRILTCRDCSQEFIFSSGEQEFFASRGLTNTPGRCPECRSARRSNQSSSPRFSRNNEQRERFETTCATCGNPTSVPFVPREDRPVYCSDCFQTQRAARGPRRDDSRSYSNSYSSNNNYSNNSYGSSSYSDNNYGGGRGERDRRDRRDYRDRRDRRDYRDRW